MDRPWPRELAAGSFSVAAGLPRSRLRPAHLHRPTLSVRSVLAPATVRERAQAFAIALPDDVAFSHVTAARLWGMAVPDGVAQDADLDVLRESDRTRIRRTGCHGHRGLERRAVELSRGLRVTGLADTWVDLGEVLNRGIGLDDLVVMGDQVATWLIPPPEPGSGTVDLDAGVGALRTTLAGSGAAAGCEPAGPGP
jgi:hypothetical protein